MRIYREVPACKIANFSTLKNLQSSNFSDFRKNFRARLEKVFVVPADTFDNVSGAFPIGFFIWDTAVDEIFEQIEADVYDKNGALVGEKLLSTDDKILPINKWISSIGNNSKVNIGTLFYRGNDFQNQKYVYIGQNESPAHDSRLSIHANNLIPAAIYFAVRKCIPATWLNDRDQFLFPNDGWSSDEEFQSDCLTYTLFSDSNNIRSSVSTNHWIPFKAEEVGARDRFASSFMTDFMSGKAAAPPKETSVQGDFFPSPAFTPKPLVFSPVAQAVFDAGRALWRYYLSRLDANLNASYYEIREHFQGRNNAGRMNATSFDPRYTELIAALRAAHRALGAAIEPKVYEYGFLRE